MTAAPVLQITLILAASSLLAAPPTEITRSSEEREFDVQTEIRSFYLELLESNAGVKREFGTLTKRSKLDGDAYFSVGRPQVIDWFPRRDRWGTGRDFQRDQHFLVVQRLESGSPNRLESDAAVVSEFRVLHQGTGRPDPKDPERKAQILSSKITIQFLGFRKLVPR